jgi:hypothetical protein
MGRVTKRVREGRRSSIQGVVIMTLLLIIICHCALLVISSISHMPFPYTLSLFCTICFLISGILRVYIILRPENRSKKF